MTSVALSPIPILQFLDNAGNLAVGGSLQTQVGGINYPTYSDAAGTTPLPNPIPLNSRGEVSTAAGSSSELFLQTGVSYTFILKDVNGNQLWSVGNITSNNIGSVSFPTSSGSANAQIVTNPVPITLGVGVIQWLLPIAANTGPTTLNVDNTGAKNIFYLTKALAFGELQIGVPAQVIYDGTQWNLINSAKGPAADYYVDTGTASAYVVLLNMAQAANTSGARFKVKVANTNASGVTMTINGTGPFSIYRQDGVLVTTGSMKANQIYDFIFDATIGGPILQNPSSVTGSATITQTGYASPPTGTLFYNIAPDGKTVTAWTVVNIGGTSNATTMSWTGIPAIIAPATSKRLVVGVQDNSAAFVYASVDTGTSTTWSFNSGVTSGSFTASGTKTTSKGVFVYTLD